MRVLAGRRVAVKTCPRGGRAPPRSPTLATTPPTADGGLSLAPDSLPLPGPCAPTCVGSSLGPWPGCPCRASGAGDLHGRWPRQARRGPSTGVDGSLPAGHGRRTPAALPRLTMSEGACSLRERAHPRRPPPALATLSQHPQGPRLPCGLQEALATLRPSWAPRSRLRQDARRATGGWLTLTRQGLSPCRDAKLVLARERWASGAAGS